MWEVEVEEENVTKHNVNQTSVRYLIYEQSCRKDFH